MGGSIVVGVALNVSDVLGGNVAVGVALGVNVAVRMCGKVGGIVGISGKVVVCGAVGIFSAGGKVAVGINVTVELGCGSTVVVNVVDIKVIPCSKELFVLRNFQRKRPKTVIN